MMILALCLALWLPLAPCPGHSVAVVRRANGLEGMPVNAMLAARARELATAAPRHSMARAAYGCAAVTLAETRTSAQARRVLTGWAGLPAIVTAALAALGRLTGGHVEP